jgi:hypothetical protein
MKNLRLLLASSALALALTFPAFAGYMDTTVASPSPTPATGEMGTPSTVAATGEMHIPIVTEVALSFMQSMLALF